YSPYAQFYDGKISFADAEFLAPLTGHMAQLDLLDDTIMVLWSDHGENLHALEHNLYWGHNWGLDETVMRTLLIMRGPGLPHGEERAQIAQSIDIFPTLLDLARLPPLPQCEGQSLLKLPLPPAPVVYMENLTQGFVGLRQGAFKLVLAESGTAANKLDRGWAAQKFERAKKRIKRFLPRRWAAAVRQTDALAAWWQAQGEPEDVLQRLLAHGERRLYNLSADPDERQNLAPGHPQEMQALVSLLRQQAGRTVTGQLAALNAEEAAQIEAHLKALGYL
ncbi:MAG: sulfatase-like hydrolase/transferase, partial [Anaerolineae bacterium]